ncbi:hypothetical protein [Catenulispora rubra]|nr:hypothetical protein [Catenulispora rubra]
MVGNGIDYLDAFHLLTVGRPVVLSRCQPGGEKVAMTNPSLAQVKVALAG